MFTSMSALVAAWVKSYLPIAVKKTSRPLVSLVSTALGALSGLQLALAPGVCLLLAAGFLVVNVGFRCLARKAAQSRKNLSFIELLALKLLVPLLIFTSVLASSIYWHFSRQASPLFQLSASHSYTEMIASANTSTGEKKSKAAKALHFRLLLTKVYAPADSSKKAQFFRAKAIEFRAQAQLLELEGQHINLPVQAVFSPFKASKYSRRENQQESGPQGLENLPLSAQQTTQDEPIGQPQSRQSPAASANYFSQQLPDKIPPIGTYLLGTGYISSVSSNTFEAGKLKITSFQAQNIANLYQPANFFRSCLKTISPYFPASAASLVPALGLGDTSNIGLELKSDLKTAGLSHLLAISGAHLAIFLSVLIVLFSASGRQKIIYLTAVLAAGAFTVVITPSSSIVRAALMATIIFAGKLVSLPLNSKQALSICFALCLLYDPYQIYAPGLQLSVASVAALLYLAPLLSVLISSFLPLKIARLVSIPLSAQIACQPLLWSFHPLIYLYCVPANIAASLLVAPLVVTSLLASLSAPLSAHISQFFGFLSAIPATGLTKIAGFFAHLPGAALPWFPGQSVRAYLSFLTLDLAFLLALYICKQLIP